MPGLPGCCSQGDNEQEALVNIQHAIFEYLEVAGELAGQKETREVEVILFGSKARGDSGADSDIDLLILTRGEPPKQMSKDMWRKFWQIQKNRNVMLSTIVVPMDRWEHGIYQAMLLKSEVERDGVIL